MKVGVVVGFLFFVVASFLWHPTTTDSTGKVTRGDSLIERWGSEKIEELEKPAPMFHDQTPEQKVKAAAKLKEASEEFARLKELSKSIPMELVSGKMPLTATYSTSSQSKNDNEVIYDMGFQCQITSYSFGLTCSGPILTTCHWYLSTSNDKKGWDPLADGDCQSKISHSGDHAIVSGGINSTPASRYVKWRVVAKGAMMPGAYTLAISDPEVKGVMPKLEVK